MPARSQWLGESGQIELDSTARQPASPPSRRFVLDAFFWCFGQGSLDKPKPVFSCAFPRGNSFPQTVELCQTKRAKQLKSGKPVSMQKKGRPVVVC